jgi:hypothetical protein
MTMSPDTTSALLTMTLWLVFGALTYCLARYGPWWCIPFGYLAVAVIIDQMHVAWITHEMSRLGWDGEPDMDIIFVYGILAHIGRVWMGLLPITIIAVWLKRRHTRLTSRGDKSTLEISFL